MSFIFFEDQSACDLLNRHHHILNLIWDILNTYITYKITIIYKKNYSQLSPKRFSQSCLWFRQSVGLIYEKLYLLAKKGKTVFRQVCECKKNWRLIFLVIIKRKAKRVIEQQDQDFGFLWILLRMILEKT